VKSVRREPQSPSGLGRLVVVLVAVIGVAAASGGCGRQADPRESGEGAPEEWTSDLDRVEEVTAPATWQTSGCPALVDLGAGKCIPCKMMAPILDEMRETFKGQLDVVFIDVWKDAAPGRQYGVKVIPTQIFFDEDGNELFRHQGFFSREDILAKWEEFGYEFEE
jgi:thioredoxin 1